MPVESGRCLFSASVKDVKIDPGAVEKSNTIGLHKRSLYGVKKGFQWILVSYDLNKFQMSTPFYTENVGVLNVKNKFMMVLYYVKAYLPVNLNKKTSKFVVRYSINNKWRLLAGGVVALFHYNCSKKDLSQEFSNIFD